VLSHLVPGNNPPNRRQEAKQGNSGNLTIGEDLLELRVGG
jgi:hypothetical protein